MMEKNNHMFVTDFDGTLFRDDRTISREDISTLRQIGQFGIIRVIATGRSLYSALKVIPADLPIDYLVFSSGAGIMEWKDRKIIRAYSLDRHQIQEIINILKAENLDFMLHKKIPDNHFFYYYRFSETLDDFERRCRIYTDYCMEWNPDEINSMDEACQFIIIAAEKADIESIERFRLLKEKINSSGNLNIIRTTSPIDKKTMWIEIFPSGVSKAAAVKTIADISSADYNNIAAVGNDFNDIQMLEFAENAFIVDNAPDELKQKFINVKSNNESGFSDAVKKWLEIKRR